MFVTTRDPGVRRRSRVYSNTRAARSSKISLLSAFTVATTSSGDSNNTVTQDSYNRSQRPKRRRTREHRIRRLSHEDGNTSVDVFDFLVEEKPKSKESLADAESKEAADRDGTDAVTDTGGSSEGEAIEGEVILKQRDISFHLDDSEPEGYYRSMSDSGISMGSGSSFTSGLPSKRHLAVLHEEDPRNTASPPRTGAELAVMDPRWAWANSSPQPYVEGFVPPPCPPAPPAVVYDVPFYQPYTYASYTPHGTPPPTPDEEAKGPRLTVREPAAQHIKPRCFRSFTKVSTRLLLQMQDDIADLEEELKELDDETDIVDQPSEQSSSSSSGSGRRARKIREEDIYRELHGKLDQYYHALEMMQKVENISRPAVVSDLHKHHYWLRSRVAETSKLRRLIGNDLRKFSTMKQEEIRHPQIFHPRYLAYSALVNAVIPLIIFKVLTGVLNRLIVLSIVIVAGSVAQDRLQKKAGRDELSCTLVFVCISAFAAVIF